MTLYIPNFIIRWFRDEQPKASGSFVQPTPEEMDGLEKHFDADGWNGTDDTDLCQSVENTIIDEKKSSGSSDHEASAP